ncbi:hypothetical protein [Bradyrhizobium sp. Ai1a-2]|uniref:hypothetical protein n=1 Tax=Bradyrhizobium sp. Ai1a-2 TaxID=196490 RepID=UPI000686B9A2|nr:hypothetical protein [Bradyrhizobium sp. Ai1a-2]
MTRTISPYRALLDIEASPSVPRLSNAQMLDAPENSAIRDIWLVPAENPTLHRGRKIAVIATDGVEEIELTTVLQYFRARGAQVDLAQETYLPGIPRPSNSDGARNAHPHNYLYRHERLDQI